MGADKKTRKRKEQLWGELQRACDTFEKALFVNTDNVTSKQICVMRKSLRDIGALMICGKNTMMKAAINNMNTEPKEDDEDYEERKDSFEFKPHLEKIVGQLRGNTSIIFTNGELTDIQKILDSEVREAPARVGSLAPKAVVIKAGPTGLDPKETAFFQKLQIATKIMKAKIEIINDFQIINEGDKITPGQSALLDKLKLRPFEYKMTIKKVMMDGNMYDPAVLTINEEDVLASFQKGVSNMTALSLGAGYVTPMSAPHLVMNAFKNLAAVAFGTDFSFPEAEALKTAAKAGPVAAAVEKVEEKVAAKVEEAEDDKESSDDALGGGMGGLFGDDY